jgi:hypothetical protein
MSEPRWYLLVHQLPPEPLYLRAKIRQRLAKVGAVALKNAAYLLPHREGCLEDFRWIGREAVAGGGEVYVCEADFVGKGVHESLVERFRRERDSDYKTLEQSLRESGPADPASRLGRARKRLEEISRIDFFEAGGKRRVARLLEEAKTRWQRGPGSRQKPGRPSKATLLGRTWVTRRGVQIDRIASAWFIRRFLDAKARFRFTDSKGEGTRPGEIRFDMVGGDYTHAADRCTLETLLLRTGVADPALGPIAQIVHDIDLKDGKFARPEAAGLERLLTGLFLSSPDDRERLDRGFAFFDTLYESFRKNRQGSKGEVKT